MEICIQEGFTTPAVPVLFPALIAQTNVVGGGRSSGVPVSTQLPVPVDLTPGRKLSSATVETQLFPFRV